MNRFYNLRALSTATKHRPPISSSGLPSRFSSSSTTALVNSSTPRHDSDRIASALEQLVTSDNERRQYDKINNRLNWAFITLFAPLAGAVVYIHWTRKTNKENPSVVVKGNVKYTITNPEDKEKYEDLVKVFADGLAPLLERAEKTQQK